MDKIADIIVNLPTRSITKPFSYLLPEPLAYIEAGWRVLVPFGNRKVEGFVVSVAQGDATGLKPVTSVLDTEPWFNGPMLDLAKWLSEYYLCSTAEALRLFIPGKAGVHSDTTYRVNETVAAEAQEQLASCRPPSREIYDTLLSGAKTLTQLTSQYGPETARVVRQLLRRNFITREVLTRRTAQAQYRTDWRRAFDPKEAETIRIGLKNKPAQRLLLDVLLHQDRLTPDDLKRLQITAATVKNAARAGLLTPEKVRLFRDSYTAQLQAPVHLELTIEQQAVLAQISPILARKESASFLLHGVTGSGKTQVYIEAAAQVRQLGRQAVILVPEIALTGQIVARFKERFGDDVVVLHSRLSVGERYDTWQRLRAGEAGIVIGARSAVFAPVPDPGLFILDEEQEFTYKQEEAPRYHAREVALRRGELAGAAVVLGSATPSLESYFQASRGQHQLLTMPSRIDDAVLPPVTIVDMCEELKAGRRGVISPVLGELLEETVAKGEQAIVLLNRRGYATFVLCRECGQVMRCGHCAVSLVYHSAAGQLRCHYCGANERVPDICPSCGSRFIRFFGTGTQKVEEELAAILPRSRIVRMDQDTTGRKMSHDRILTAFAAGEYDILLGTQMVAKGHDIKNVTAVGIVSADTSLHLPDFRSAERTFMLLTQAAGRAGRGKQPGRVVVQTYNPEHYAIETGSRHDYLAFYQQELECRRELSYPPFTDIVKLTVRGSDEARNRRQAEEIAAGVAQRLDGLEQTSVIGPFAPPVARIKDVFRLHILIKTADLTTVRAVLTELDLAGRGEVSVDVGPQSVL